MENERLDNPNQTPKPAWQVWLTRVGFVLFVIAVALCSIYLFRGI